MVSRFAASFALLFLCATALPQTSGQPDPRIPKIFHDALLSITYFYPGRFTPVPPASNAAKADAAASQCARATLSADSTTPTGTSIFVLSTIDNTCPSVLKGASTDLGAFVREQILRQIKRYGTPTIIQEPTHYIVDGHPAIITVASAEAAPEKTLNNIIPPKITYAAKACVLGNIPVKPRKHEVAEPTRHVLCFDFTTQQRELLSLMYGFTMQFDNHPPEPLVPGSALR
jgi:hypothetical protein